MPNKAIITGRILKTKANRNLSFLLNYGNISGLGERISDVKVFEENDKSINVRRMIAGEYLAERAFNKFAYQIDLTPLKEPFAAAHVSWLDKGGILMLNDLMPQFGKRTSARIRFDLSGDLTFATNESVVWPLSDPVTIKVEDLDQALFFIFLKDANRHINSPSVKITLDVFGDWPFLDPEAGEIAVAIFDKYKQVFRTPPIGDVVISLHKFPMPVAPEIWEADTRGRTVMIFSSDSIFKSQSLQRLHEQLRHELFHLWFPNGVNLTGNYDWFYEGFALYQSLKTGVALNRIRFDDYLDTLSRAYDIDRKHAQKISLIEASQNRWIGSNNTQIYARGMLVAFLCDLALLEKSKGKRSVSDLLRQLYERHRAPNPEADGNTAVLTLLRSYSELTPIIDRNITGAESIEWNNLLKGAGLEAEPKDQTTKLKVTAKPSGRQKDLLDKLGYNNWRKLASK